MNTDPKPDLTETQKAYNVAQYELFQLAAYGHCTYTNGEMLTDEGRRRQRDYNDRILAASEELEAAVLRLVAEHAETFRGDWGVVANWLRSVAGDPEYLSLMAVRPDERGEILDGRPGASSAGPVHLLPEVRGTMSDNKDPQTCPGCQHPQHAPGVECEHRVEHEGQRRWHLCLCLNQLHADRPCPPLMACQGGTLGYADIWYLQRGQSLQGANGEAITPDVLNTSAPPVPPSRY